MSRTTQGLVLAFLGAVLIRLVWEGAYLRFVTEWMRWPLLVSGVVLVLLAVRPILTAGSSGDGHEQVPAMTWLLFLPALVVFVISPPALGAYLAERRAGEATPTAPVSTFAPLPPGDDPVPLEVEELVWRAQVDEGATLAGRSVRLRGFVSHGPDGQWFVTRMVIGCCAADAAVVRVRVDGLDRPPRDAWVAVTGTWRAGTGEGRRDVPVLDGASSRRIAIPADVYG